MNQRLGGSKESKKKNEKKKKEKTRCLYNFSFFIYVNESDEEQKRDLKVVRIGFVANNLIFGFLGYLLQTWTSK